MLRITVELVPFGDEEHKKPIAVLLVANMGSNPSGGHNYEFVYSEPKPLAGAPLEMAGRYSLNNRLCPVLDTLKMIFSDCATWLVDVDPRFKRRVKEFWANN